ncbi:MAG: hypothetical protein CMJ81_11460 [Planctomycetaceae bacterium]|nr:hypothetical protein [Planctomycetaceae bacterium]MBP61694.1 hypothetical protein [Planctomycetaceae bacterium]
MKGVRDPAAVDFLTSQNLSQFSESGAPVKKIGFGWPGRVHRCGTLAAFSGRFSRLRFLVEPPASPTEKVMEDHLTGVVRSGAGRRLRSTSADFTNGAALHHLERLHES